MPTSDDIDAADLRETIARQKIADVLTRYSRGIDRCDIDTLSAVFWPDATTDYGSGRQNAHDWARATVSALKRMHRTQHAISNMAIDVAGDAARAETYCQAYHEIDGPSGGRVEMVVGGRYLDRLERRGGAWRIADRTYVMDWNRNIPSTAQWDEGIYAGLKRRGGRLPDDPLADFLAS
jgi:SnoaL-like domain